MKIDFKAVLGFVPVLIVFAPVPATAQNIALQIQHCIEETTEPLVRIDACSVVIESGRVINPQRFLMQRGRLYFQQRMRAEGIADFTAAMKFYGNWINVPYLDAVRLCNNKMERPLERIEACSVAIESARESDIAPLLMQRGLLSFNEDMYAQAVADFRELTNHQPVTSGGHNSAARAP